MHNTQNKESSMLFLDIIARFTGYFRNFAFIYYQ